MPNDKLREEFEKWFVENYDKPEAYTKQFVENFWLCWQAGRASFTYNATEDDPCHDMPLEI